MNNFKFTIVGESELTDDEIADILQDEMSKLETLLNGEIGIGYYEPINEQGERRMARLTRLIDADALKDWSEIVQLTDDGGIDINDFEEKLESMPTVDVVQVIWCKDCFAWNEEEQHGCTHDMGANDFCSKAERKEE